MFTGFLIKKSSELELDCVGEHIALDKCLEDTLEYSIKVKVRFQFNFSSKHTAPSAASILPTKLFVSMLGQLLEESNFTDTKTFIGACYE